MTITFTSFWWWFIQNYSGFEYLVQTAFSQFIGIFIFFGLCLVLVKILAGGSFVRLLSFSWLYLIWLLDQYFQHGWCDKCHKYFYKFITRVFHRLKLLEDGYSFSCYCRLSIVLLSLNCILRGLLFQEMKAVLKITCLKEYAKHYFY